MAVSGELPAEMRDALTQLMASFRGTMGFSLDPAVMQAEVTRNRSLIDVILAYSTLSERNAETLSEQCCSSLSAYAERFKPGTEIDAETLRASAYNWGTAPDYGLSIQAYLVLETARQRRSAYLGRRALNTLSDVMSASSYFAEKWELAQVPEATEEIRREKREYGGCLSPLGAEIAWCCEQFMVEVSVADDPGMPEAGMAVIRDYCRWRQETMAKQVTPYCLYATHQYQTMAYAKRLADALAPQQGAAPGTP